LWKSHWVRTREPGNFERAWKWLDVRDYLPPVQSCLDRSGELTPEVAQELGLPKGTPVFAGGGDIPLIRIRSTYTPNPLASKVYGDMFPVFKALYKRNKKLFWQLNEKGTEPP